MCYHGIVLELNVLATLETGEAPICLFQVLMVPVGNQNSKTHSKGGSSDEAGEERRSLLKVPLRRHIHGGSLVIKLTAGGWLALMKSCPCPVPLQPRQAASNRIDSNVLSSVLSATCGQRGGDRAAGPG
jgi:hypothetical protein